MFNCFYSSSRFCSDLCDLFICTFVAYFIKVFWIFWKQTLSHTLLRPSTSHHVTCTDRCCTVDCVLHASKVSFFFLVRFKLVLTPVQQQFAERHRLLSISRLWNLQLRTTTSLSASHVRHNQTQTNTLNQLISNKSITLSGCPLTVALDFNRWQLYSMSTTSISMHQLLIRRYVIMCFLW